MEAFHEPSYYTMASTGLGVSSGDLEWLADGLEAFQFFLCESFVRLEDELDGFPEVFSGLLGGADGVEITDYH